MKVKEAKDKYCPLTFNGKGDSHCVPGKCMWWIDEGQKVDTSGTASNKIGQCVITKLTQALYDTKGENK